MLKHFSNQRRWFGAMEKFAQSLSNSGNIPIDLGTKDPRMHESPFKFSSYQPTPTNRNVSKLPNGIRVVTETPLVPGPVTFGVLLDVGTRDETKENSGALHSIKTTYYKSNLNTNETINFGMVQMSGGKYEMNYDRETTIFKATCLAHDVVDLFGMVSDCVLEPRTFATANVAISKLPHSHKLHSIQQSHHAQTDKLLSACYGNKGLGMPHLGFEKNIINLDAHTLQKFQIENFSPEKIIIAGVGVENHGEFLELVDNFYGNLAYGAAKNNRESQKFTETELKTKNDSLGKNEAIIVFESSSWKSNDLIMNFLAREVLGSADVANPDCLEANRGIFSSEIYQKHKSVHSIESFNMHFSDSGMFGFRLQTNPDSTNNAIEVLASAINNVGNITQSQFDGAKKRLKRRIIESLGRDWERVEEVLKHQNAYNDFRVEQFLRDIDGTSLQNLANWFQGLTKQGMAVLLEGPSLSNVHSHGKIKGLFK